MSFIQVDCRILCSLRSVCVSVALSVYRYWVPLGSSPGQNCSTPSPDDSFPSAVSVEGTVLPHCFLPEPPATPPFPTQSHAGDKTPDQTRAVALLHSQADIFLKCFQSLFLLGFLLHLSLDTRRLITFL